MHRWQVRDRDHRVLMRPGKSLVYDEGELEVGQVDI